MMDGDLPLFAPWLLGGALAPGLLATALFGYLLGSIPFGLLLTRAAGLGDVRNVGSGNIGATNVLRTGNKGLALATLVLDAGKGALAVLLTLFLLLATPYAPALYVAGVAAFLGHVFPVWLGFRGGKGVATYIGILLALAWPVGLAFCAAWLATALLTRLSSLAALVAAALVPIAAFLASGAPLALTCLLLSALLFFTHRANIARLRAGTETRIGGGKPEKSDP